MTRRRRPVLVLTPRELAERWRIHVNTVTRIADRGELPCFRIGSRGDRRFWMADVVAYEQREWMQR